MNVSVYAYVIPAYHSAPLLTVCDTQNYIVEIILHAMCSNM